MLYLFEFRISGEIMVHRFLAAVFLIASACPSVGAQTLELRRPDPATEATPEIIGGRKADLATWPATFVFNSASGKRCTATVVGPRVVLTAAHCVTGAVDGRIVDTSLRLACQPHDYYSSGSLYDIALCVTSGVVKLERDAPYETIEATKGPAKRGALTLLGYGCVSPNGPGGTLYEGASYVQQVADPKRPYFVTSGGAAVCSGDSGGGAYRLAGQFSRRVVGVASMDATAGQSNFSQLAEAEAVRWMRSWAASQTDPVTRVKVEVRICGLDALFTCHP